MPRPRTPDDVDGIIAAWEQARPDLDVTPLAVLSRVSRLARRLDLARGAAFAEQALDGWEFDVLSALRRAGDPYELSPGQLVAETLVTSGTMTNRVDRLAARGFVERRPSATDRRGVIVRLTSLGLSTVDAAMAELLDASSSRTCSGASSARSRADAARAGETTSGLRRRPRPPPATRARGPPARRRPRAAPD
jgi:DNA-binding MarR family transcriptional regulator